MRRSETPSDSGSPQADELFRSRLDSQIDLRHPLAQLAGRMPWAELECLNEHWFTGLLQARTIIETWRREYNEERSKKALGGLTPAGYARQLATQLT